MLLALPASGVTAWLQSAPIPAKMRTAGLTFEVATAAAACASADALAVTVLCANLYVWDPFTPPIPDFADDASVRAYGEVAVDLNPFVEAAYVGAELLVEAIRAVGPNLTRDQLKAELDRITYRSPLVGGLSWSHGDPSRVGNRSARALRYEDGALVDAGTGWVTDPWSGLERRPLG